MHLSSFSCSIEEELGSVWTSFDRNGFERKCADLVESTWLVLSIFFDLFLWCCQSNLDKAQ